MHKRRINERYTKDIRRIYEGLSVSSRYLKHSSSLSQAYCISFLRQEEFDGFGAVFGRVEADEVAAGGNVGVDIAVVTIAEGAGGDTYARSGIEGVRAVGKRLQAEASGHGGSIDDNGVLAGIERRHVEDSYRARRHRIVLTAARRSDIDLVADVENLREIDIRAVVVNLIAVDVPVIAGEDIAAVIVFVQKRNNIVPVLLDDPGRVANDEADGVLRLAGGAEVVIEDEFCRVVVGPDVVFVLFAGHRSGEIVIEGLVDDVDEAGSAGIVVKEKGICARARAREARAHVPYFIVCTDIFDGGIRNNGRLLVTQIEHGNRALSGLGDIDGVVIESGLSEFAALEQIRVSLADSDALRITTGGSDGETEYLSRVAAAGRLQGVGEYAGLCEPLALVPIRLDIATHDGLNGAVGRVDGELEAEDGVATGTGIDEGVVINASLGVSTAAPEVRGIIADGGRGLVVGRGVDFERKAIDYRVAGAVFHLNRIVIDAALGKCAVVPSVGIAVAHLMLHRDYRNGVFREGDIEYRVAVAAVLGAGGIFVISADVVAVAVVHEVFVLADVKRRVTLVNGVDGENEDVRRVATVAVMVFKGVFARLAVADTVEDVFLAFADSGVGSIPQRTVCDDAPDSGAIAATLAGAVDGISAAGSYFFAANLDSVPQTQVALDVRGLFGYDGEVEPDDGVAVGFGFAGIGIYAGLLALDIIEEASASLADGVVDIEVVSRVDFEVEVDDGVALVGSGCAHGINSIFVEQFAIKLVVVARADRNVLVALVGVFDAEVKGVVNRVAETIFGTDGIDVDAALVVFLTAPRICLSAADIVGVEFGPRVAEVDSNAVNRVTTVGSVRLIMFLVRVCCGQNRVLPEIVRPRADIDGGVVEIDGVKCEVEVVDRVRAPSRSLVFILIISFVVVLVSAPGVWCALTGGFRFVEGVGLVDIEIESADGVAPGSRYAAIDSVRINTGAGERPRDGAVA